MKGSCAVATDKIKSAASETDLSPVEAADRDSPPAQKKKIYWLSETNPFVIKDFDICKQLLPEYNKLEFVS